MFNKNKKSTVCQISEEELDRLTDKLIELQNENSRLEAELDKSLLAVEHQMGVINMLFVRLNQLEGKVLYPVEAEEYSLSVNGDYDVRTKGPRPN